MQSSSAWQASAIRPPRARALAWALGLAAALVLGGGGGCAGYRLGPTNGQAARETSVQFKPFLNQTLEPRLPDTLNEQLRKQLQRDGTYRLATRDDGDIIVSGVITRYSRREMSFVPSDVTTVRDYRIGLEAQVTAVDRRTGKVVLDQLVKGFTLLRVGSNMPNAERQALPLLASDLARNVTTLLADGSW